MKYDRGIFLYLEPRKVDGDEYFAQCGSCRMFVPESALKEKDGSRCIIHGAKMDVDDDDSCGFWVPWPKGEPVQHVIDDHAGELDKGIAASVTPEESGFVSDEVQCHRCEMFREADNGKIGRCGLYETLNATKPKMFALDTKVEPHACCNAWTDEIKPATDLRSQIAEAIRG